MFSIVRSENDPIKYIDDDTFCLPTICDGTNGILKLDQTYGLDIR